MGYGFSGMAKGVVCLLIVTLAACASGDDFDIRGRGADPMVEEFGITPDDATSLTDGSRVMFFGDSITAGGVKAGGYVRLVERAVANLYPERDIDVRGSGVEGDTVADLLRRLRRDVLAKRPTHVVIYVGVNDLASLGPGEAAARKGEQAYAAGLTDLVTRIQATGASVTICTPGLIGEDLEESSRTNRLLERFAAVARSVAAEMHTGLCDVRADFASYLKTRNRSGKTKGILTLDGIHLTSQGHRVLAGTMLRALVAAPAPSTSPSALRSNLR
jgi:lysophospholipase L1-like esterase